MIEDPQQNNQEAYDPRWFIWTIVFLVSTGVMLVTYIVTSDDSNDVAVDYPSAMQSKISK